MQRQAGPTLTPSSDQLAAAAAAELRQVTGEEWVVRRRRRGPWGPLGVSAFIHAVLIWLLLRVVPVVPPVEPLPAAPAPPALSLPAWQPPSETAPQPPPPPATPLGPDSKRPDAEIPREAAESPRQVDPDELDPTQRLGAGAPPVASPQADAVPTPPDPAVTPTPTRSPLIPGPARSSQGSLLANASRWGRPVPDPTAARSGQNGAAPPPSGSVAGGSGRVGVQPTDGQQWQPSFEEPAGRCVTLPDLGVDADGKPRLASVLGRVFREDRVTPLVGAHLQIIGTAFSTFSSGTGEYELRFNPTLLEKCRVQYVRVTAPGYEGAMLTLSIGARVRSDDVVLRRR